jgi:hypothetical protein
MEKLKGVTIGILVVIQRVFWVWSHHMADHLPEDLFRFYFLKEWRL